MGSLVLFSGGLDSVCALYHTLHHGSKPVHALTFDYGQRHYGELSAASTIARMAGGYGLAGHRLLKINYQLMPNRASIMSGGVPVKQYDKIPTHEEGASDPSFVPHRNLLFLSIAAGWAHHYGAGTIVTGLRGGFPDCTLLFEEALQKALAISDPEFPIKLFSPVHISRAETIKLAYSLPGCWDAIAHSMTCFNGDVPPCGKCLPCLKRAEGFAKYGKQDPLFVRLTTENKGAGRV